MIGLQTNASVECRHQFLCSREADMSTIYMHYNLALPTWKACLVKSAILLCNLTGTALEGPGLIQTARYHGGSCDQNSHPDPQTYVKVLRMLSDGNTLQLDSLSARMQTFSGAHSWQLPCSPSST